MCILINYLIDVFEEHDNDGQIHPVETDDITWVVILNFFEYYQIYWK